MAMVALGMYTRVPPCFGIFSITAGAARVTGVATFGKAAGAAVGAGAARAAAAGAAGAAGAACAAAAAAAAPAAAGAAGWVAAPSSSSLEQPKTASSVTIKPRARIL